MASVRRTMYSQFTVTGGVTIEGDIIRKKTAKEIEAILDRELKGLKKDLMNEIRKMKE